VKVLFDHNVPHKLSQSLLAHDVSTADELGWSELENGELLRAAEIAGFAVMVTADKNLSSQQNLRGRELALVVLSTNNWNVLKRDPRPVVDAVDTAKPGSFQIVTLESPLARHRHQTPKL
jgi:predicted nuclease of predicted toxin-antitoxin system